LIGGVTRRFGPSRVDLEMCSGGAVAAIAASAYAAIEQVVVATCDLDAALGCESLH